jgi:hypothetical protein
MKKQTTAVEQIDFKTCNYSMSCDTCDCHCRWNDGCDCECHRGFAQGMRWYAGSEDEEFHADDTNKRKVIAEIVRDAASRGLDRVTIKCYVGDEETVIVRRVRIAGSEFKAEIDSRAEQRMKELKRKEDRLRLEAAVKGIERGWLTWENLDLYYASWQRGDRTGLQAKRSLIARMVKVAKENGWANGAKAGVLYVDTPHGQVSWHLCDPKQFHASQIAELEKEYPPYPGEWSGKRNSKEVLALLYRTHMHLLADDPATEAFAGAECVETSV